MSLAAPLGLLLLGLGLPIVALYLMRTQRPTLPASTLLFWQQLKPRSYNSPLWRKLRRWISLLLQLLCLLLLALAVAHPLLPGMAPSAASTIYVLDPSASMRANGHFKKARQSIQEAVKTLRHPHEACLILASDPPSVEVSWTCDPNAFAKALKTLRPQNHNTSIAPALELARNLASSRPGSTIRLLSDGVWSRQPVPGLSDIYWKPMFDEPVPNTAITLFSASRIPSSLLDYEIVLKAEHFGKTPVEATLSLYQDGRLFQAEKLSLERGSPFLKTWKSTGSQNLSLTAVLEGLKDDAIPADNEAALRLERLSIIRVELFSKPSPFLESALESIPGIRWIRRWPLDEWSLPLETKPDLVIFNDCTPPGPSRGEGVLIINPPQEGFWGKPDGTIPTPVITATDSQSRLMRFVELDGLIPGGAREYELPENTQTLAWVEEHPVLFGRQEGSRWKWLVVGFDLGKSDLVLRTAFPIFLTNLMNSLREGDSARSVLPGSGESALQAVSAEEAHALSPEEAPSPQITMGHSIWWWLAVGVVLWVVLEWNLFSRRVTE